jgi:DNA-binding MarR family transcriptional regulator
VPHRSEPRLVVLHTLRLKGFTEVGPIAHSTGLEDAAVDGHLAGLAAEGLVVRREGRVSGWSLTPVGREAHVKAVADELAAAGARPVIEVAYRRFLGLNADMLSVCTDWQLRTVAGTAIPNDHTDAAYDAGVLGRLGSIHEGVLPVASDLAGAMTRFGRYGDRLATALERVTAGEQEWFTKPVIDSYHTVWFELHEDLLCTLGLERASETSSA